MRSLDPFDKMEKEINELSPPAENGNNQNQVMINSAPANHEKKRLASGAMSLGEDSDDDISRAV